MLGVRELEARDPPVTGDVLDLLGDLGVVEGGQVGEGLEELCEGERGRGAGVSVWMESGGLERQNVRQRRRG